MSHAHSCLDVLKPYRPSVRPSVFPSVCPADLEGSDFDKVLHAWVVNFEYISRYCGTFVCHMDLCAFTRIMPLGIKPHGGHFFHLLQRNCCCYFLKHRIFLVNSTVMSYVTCPLTQLKMFVFLVYVRFVACLIMLHSMSQGLYFVTPVQCLFPIFFSIPI